MKVTFIYPRFEKFLQSIPDLDQRLVDHFIGNFTTPPSLGIPILAALTPPEWTLELIDDNNGDPIDFQADTDLVAINCFTPQATRAFELADQFREAGKRVVMGGFFPSTAPKDALEHANAVNIGDGEPTWANILEDVKNDRLKPVYKGGTRFDLANMPIPKREIFYNKSGYDWNEDLVQIARGCLFNCGMCAIPSHQGHRIRLRPIEKIVKEIASLKYDNVYLAEDILFFQNRRIADWSKRLFSALAPLGKKLFVSSTLSLTTSSDYLSMISNAGVDLFYCTLNVDPKSIRALSGDKRARGEVIDTIRRIEDHGMRFFASFGLGRDWDGPGLADSILDICQKAKIRTAEFFLFTPFPASPSWERLQRQGRILHKEWRLYNGAHVVTKPINMSVDALYEQFVYVWREFYRGLSFQETVEKLSPDQSEDHMQERRIKVANRSAAIAGR